MKLKKIKFTNFRLFENFELDFPDENFIVIIGGNGSGKSTILDGISLCLEHFVGKLTSDIPDSHNIRYYLKNFDISENKKITELNLSIDVDNQNIGIKIDKSRNIGNIGFDISNENFLTNTNLELKSGKRSSIPVFYYYEINRSDYPGRSFNCIIRSPLGHQFR